MRELIADLFISLDGFASGANEAAFFGYDGPNLRAWVDTELNRPQVLLMGRNTYTGQATFAAAATDPMSIRMRELPKLVFSTTLREPLPWSNTQIIAGDLEQQIRTLKQQPGNAIRSIGSIQLVPSMMHHGLVDRLQLMIFPVILGDTGQEPIYAALQRTALQLIDTKVLDARLVLLEYGPQHRAKRA
jgi:dihydrofolate reductase